MPSKPKRTRATKAEMDERRVALIDIVTDMKPMTVRQVFYQASVRGIVDKTEGGYVAVQSELAAMRKSGDLDYDWIVDSSRRPLKYATYASPAEALMDCAETYNKSLWVNADVNVQIWVEKDALVGVIRPITSKFDVWLWPAHGYASLSFLHSAAESIASQSVPTFIYHFGDYDPSGVNAGEVIERDLRKMAPESEIHFERMAVTRKQITAWNLPTRPTKSKDTRAKAFGGDESVELDAIEPDRLRSLVTEVIERHMSPQRFEQLMAEEEKEREAIRGLVNRMVGDR